MKINKQLFEDILSGKLKGTFVLKNGITVNSNKLKLTDGSYYSAYAFKGMSHIYDCNGKTLVSGCSIIDFIIAEIDPEMYSYNEKDIQFIEHFIKGHHMKENELTIEIPKGKEIDWDESKKQNKIVFKNKQLTYKDVCERLFENIMYYTKVRGEIAASNTACVTDPNNAPTKHQLECILAKNKLANVCRFLNGSINYSTIESCWGFDLVDKMIKITYYRPQESTYYQPQFVCKSKEFAQQAIEILGEETVKLALEPLGI